MVVDQLHGIVKAADPHYAEHWPKDLFLVNAHVSGDVIEQAATHKIAILMASDGQATAIRHQRSASVHTVFNKAKHFIAMLCGDQRAHIQAFIGTRAHLQLSDFGQHGFH